MFRNYLKIAWRNLWKNKIYSAINIAGLAIGMAASIVMLLFVFYEKSFDRFHSKNLYRLNEVQKFPGMVASQKVALSMFPMGPTLTSIPCTIRSRRCSCSTSLNGASVRCRSRSTGRKPARR
ncbi:MAG TPA: ABC transporter permease [Puia sp.]|jgi:putative ABC transport system permease protein|nr:ABC transporter permease [Puia sp.]